MATLTLRAYPIAYRTSFGTIGIKITATPIHREVEVKTLDDVLVAISCFCVSLASDSEPNGYQISPDFKGRAINGWKASIHNRQYTINASKAPLQ